jgi:hypothetical protein
MVSEHSKFANGATSAAMVHLFNHEGAFKLFRRSSEVMQGVKGWISEKWPTTKNKALAAAVVVDKTTFNGTFTEPHTATFGLSGGASLGPGYRQENGLYFSYDLFNLNVEFGRYRTDSILIGWEAGGGGSVGFFNTFAEKRRGQTQNIKIHHGGELNSRDV